MVALYDEEALLAIQDSWGRFCDKVLFVVDEKDGQHILEDEARNSSLETIVPIYTQTRFKDGEVERDSWEKMWKFWIYLEEHHHGEYDYILRADTDTWFHVNNNCDTVYKLSVVL